MHLSFTRYEKKIYIQFAIAGYPKPRDGGSERDRDTRLDTRVQQSPRPNDVGGTRVSDDAADISPQYPDPLATRLADRREASGNAVPFRSGGRTKNARARRINDQPLMTTTTTTTINININFDSTYAQVLSWEY